MRSLPAFHRERTLHRLGLALLLGAAVLFAAVLFPAAPAAAEGVAEAPEWSNYCDPERSDDGACFVRQRIECIGRTDGDRFEGFCKVGDGSRFQENNWPSFLCGEYEAGSDECYPVSEAVTCYSQQEFGSGVCPVEPFDSGGLLRTPEVFTTAAFIVPVSEGGWLSTILWVVGIGVVGFGVLAAIGAMMGGAGPVADIADTSAGDPPPSPPSAPRSRVEPEEIDRISPQDLEVSARIENWRAEDAIDIRIVPPPADGGTR